MISIIKGLLGLNQKTNGSSTVGYEGSTGSGEEKTANGKSGINWTTVVLSIIIFVAGYCITPFWVDSGTKPNADTDSSVVVTTGIPDTTYSEGETTQGTITTSIPWHATAAIGDTNIHELPKDSTEIYEPLETKVDSTLKQGTEVHIRATAWSRDKQASQVLEWNIKERPCSEVIRVDTIRITTTAPNKQSFWDNRFVPTVGVYGVYNPFTKGVDYGIGVGIGIRLN